MAIEQFVPGKLYKLRNHDVVIFVLNVLHVYTPRDTSNPEHIQYQCRYLLVAQGLVKTVYIRRCMWNELSES
jgi:hypothetical protein